MRNIMKKFFTTLMIIVLGFGFANTQVANAQDHVHPSDSNLEQTVTENEKIVKDTASIDNGHIDIGPRIIDGKLKLLLRDDSQTPSVWRELDKTVLRLKDSSKKKLPEKEDFNFITESTDGYIYVSPQIQKEGVLWAGWNTQSPEIIENLSKGAAIRLLNVQGPGQMTMFLESGTFAAPTVLWDSNKNEGQDIWMDLNTHTHANWVFTKPGAYLVNLELSVQLKDGSVERNIETLRFAVGEEITDKEVLKTKAKPQTKNASKDLETEVKREATNDEKFEAIKPLIYAGIGVVVVGLALVIFVVMRNNKDKKKAYKQVENM